MSLRRLTQLLSGSLATLGLASSAGATLFTLSQAVDIDFTGTVASVNGGVVDAQLRPVFDVSGSIGSPSAGVASVNTVAHDVFVFDLVAFNPSAPIDQLSASLGLFFPFPNPQGAGYLCDAGVGSCPGTGQAPDAVASDGFVLLNATWGFDATNQSPGNVEEGETSRRLFITYSPGVLTPGGPANFMVSSGTDDDFQGTIVPEPSTLGLLVGGLAVLSLGLRRRKAVA